MDEVMAESGEVTETPESNSQETAAAEEVIQPTVEEVAKAMGWRPKESMKDPNKFVDAATYIKRTASIKDDYKREITQLKRTVEGIAKTFENATQAQYQKGIQDAEKRMAEAKEAYDFDKFEQAQREAAYLKQQASTVNTPNSEIQDFIDRNEWFDKDKEMTADALDYKERYIKANPGAPANEVLAYVEKRIKRDYPDQFKEPEPEQRRQPAVEGVRAGNTVSENWQKWEKQLSTFEKDIMDAMTQQTHNGKPVISKKQYIESLAAQGRFERSY